MVYPIAFSIWVPIGNRVISVSPKGTAVWLRDTCLERLTIPTQLILSRHAEGELNLSRDVFHDTYGFFARLSSSK